ncbi:DUF7527 domain-containing protein [Halomicrobium salinisoli]|uniref:DUF7527 domain-containing protein n=1 Tax=Halomicrobium salinisoli TaxID=2878391 RepID=UPI001CF0193F|nr:hypothetical protein [Halomicrobium salinisoli]
MVTRTVEQVDDWETVPFSGGYDGLRDLADDDFSGVVTSGPAKLFMLGGSVVGVLEGSIEDYEGADGTARRAPHRALPLLALMQERSDEVRAKYYTEDTPIADVDRTLSDGGFTGYVELSENVLSGDYYQVYHQGRSMSVAWVGAAERLITDDEAFEQANDEVGIFEVRPAEVDVIDIPDSGGSAAGGEGDVGADAPEAGSTAGGEGSTGTSAGATGDSTSGGNAGADGSVDGSTGAVSGTGAGESARSTADEPGDEPGSPTGVDAGSAPAGAKAAGGRSAGRDRSGVGESTETSGREAGADAGSETGDPSAREPSPSDEPTSARDDSSARSGRSESRPESGGREPADQSAATDEDATDRSVADGTEAREESRRRGADRGARTDDQRAGDAGVNRPDEGRQPTGSGGDRATESEARTEAAERRRPERSQSSSATDAGGAPASTDRDRGSTAADPTQPSAGGGSAPVDGSSGQSSGDGGAGSGDAGPAAGGAGGAADLEVRSIPSLDPAQTEAASAGVPRAPPESAGENGAVTEDADAGPSTTDGRSAGSESAGAPAREAGAEPTGTADAGPERTSEPADAGEPAATDAAAADTGRSTAAPDEDLRADLEAARERADDLESELARVESERDQLREERDDLAAERDELQADLSEARDEIERLERRVDELAEDSATAGAETRLGPGEAIDRTNLFVRYDSKGEATLETAHAGDADRSTVDSNLRLEYHTQFDADSAAVGDRAFDDFLRGTVRYRFVDWLVRNLLYEIRDTGNADTMTDLYDALPKVDRAELNGQISVEYTEDGETQRTQVQFDVVVRDRMGNPLVVANINDSRDPATQSMMTELVTRAEQVGGSSDSLAGAFLVTESFFEPGALETAEEETSSGLFSRDKRKSFVNLSRKSGFHLCLVEARNQEFHLAVPEL